MDGHEKAVARIVAAVVSQSDIWVDSGGPLYITSEISRGRISLYNLIVSVSKALQDQDE
jgi:hypothetical protein